MKAIHIRLSVLVIALSLLQTAGSTAQTSLQSQLEEKSTLTEIMQVVDNYYQGKAEGWRGPDGNDRKYKHWKRWEWYMSSRLGKNGEFVDIPEYLLNADRKIEAMEGDSDLRSPNGFWTSEGPVSTNNIGIGRAERIAFHPNDPLTFYVGTPAGGLWKTTDGGGTWIPLTDHLPSLGISGIVVSHDNPNEIFILTGDADSDNIAGGLVLNMGYVRKTKGVFRSLDGGATWHARGEVYGFNHLAFKMVQQPTDADVLLIATSQGIFRSDNAGLTWTQTRTGEFNDVEFLPGTQFAVAAGTSEICYSLSGGIAWGVSNLNVPLNDPDRVEIEVTPDHATGVYLLVGEVESDSSHYGTYWSTNSGLSFDRVTNMPNILGADVTGNGTHNQSAYDMAMAVSPTDYTNVVTGAVWIWRSTNGGQNYHTPQAQTHSDIHDLAYNPLDDILYACTDGGVYRSLDDGLTWQPLWIGFVTGQMYHMRGTPLNNNDFLAGSQDIGIQKRHSGSYWENVMGADGFDVCFYPTDASKFYATLDVRLFRMDGTFQDVSPVSSWFGTVASHVNDPTTVFAGYANVYKSVNNGTDWVSIGGSGSWAIATCPSDPDRLYSAGANGYTGSSADLQLCRFDDGGSTLVSIDDPQFSNVSKITDIGVSPVNADLVYITVGGFNDEKKVYRSVDAGSTWINWTDNLPNIPVHCIAVANDGVSVYVGTDLGVFYRRVGWSKWVPFRNGFPKVPVTDLYIQNNAGKVFASTFGRGVWSANLVSTCPNSMTLFGSVSGYARFAAVQQINTTSTATQGAGNELHITAGSRILLKPGFRIKRNSTFTAAIEGCN